MNSIRKIAGYLLLSVALLLIANSILPHHHHEDEVCFVANHCNDHEKDHPASEHKHDATEHEHHDSNSDICQINSFYLASIEKNSLTKIKLTNSAKDKKPNTINANCNEGNFPSGYISSNFLLEDHQKLITRSLTRAFRAPPLS